MRLLQWNIQWCRGMDGAVDPARIARVAKQIADPDVACFQEVAINFPALAGSSGEDQVELLRREFPGYTAVFGVAVEVTQHRLEEMPPVHGCAQVAHVGGEDIVKIVQHIPRAPMDA